LIFIDCGSKVGKYSDMMKGDRMQLIDLILFILKLGCLVVYFPTIYSCQRALVTPLELQITDNADLRINEILFNPLPGGVDFVELYNPTDVPLDLGSYAVATRTKNGLLNPIISLHESSKRIINSRDYVVVTTDPKSVQTHYPRGELEDMIQVSKFPNFPNQSGLVILLKDTSNTAHSTQYKVIDSVAYATSMHHPLLKNYQGVSLERVVTSTADKLVFDLTPTSLLPGGAAPGFPNSHQPTAPFGMWIEQLTKADDGTGSRLHYSFEKANLMGLVEIYDMKGRLQQKIVKNELIGAKGIWHWDGKIAENKIASPGLYTLYIELYDLFGYRRKFRKSFSLTPIN